MWGHLSDKKSSLHLWSYFGPTQQLPNASHSETVGHNNPLTRSQWTATLCQEETRVSKLLPGSVPRDPRSCWKLFFVSRLPYSYLAHILAWHPKLILSNLLQLSQLKTQSLSCCLCAGEVWAWFWDGNGFSHCVSTASEWAQREVTVIRHPQYSLS